MEIAPRFENFLLDWDYETQLLVGGYGSGKSYHIAEKLIIKCFEEKRKVLVVREVNETHKESTYDLFKEILDSMDLLGTKQSQIHKARDKVLVSKSPMQFEFPNGSRIIFKGMDDPQKMKSINDVSIVWLEECSEIKYEGYKELLGRLRHRTLKMYFILSTNPVGKENWVYRHFFKSIDKNGRERTILDDEMLYKKKTIVRRNTYYHHSTADDNPFLPKAYVDRLNELKEYDKDLYRVARRGRFGITGTRVLPQFEIAKNPKAFVGAIRGIPERLHFTGMDFGFEDSYNAVIKCAVDDKKKILYIYWEYYKNHMTDNKTADELKRKNPELLEHMIVADSAEPKAIHYYRQRGFKMRGAKKDKRLSATRKIKRFTKIVCSPMCKNTIRELEGLTYAKDKQGNMIYDEFNIDPHTLSAIWYALDTYTVADLKDIKTNSRKGG